jgi:hypothetical protein
MPDPNFQVVIYCAQPDPQARFWAQALHYELEEPPEPFSNWREYWVDKGVPPEEVGDGYDSIVDPTGKGPRIWFYQVDHAKTVKNRLHFDLLVGGGRALPIEERKQRVDAEVARLVALGATVHTVKDLPEYDHYFASMTDPEGNEFDVV